MCSHDSTKSETRLKHVRPSSQERLERWALALRQAQIERGKRPVLDDDGLRSCIWRRMEGEYRRDRGLGGVVDAICASLGSECVEYRVARHEAKRLSKSVQAWSELFARDWERVYVPISAAVYWIATKGRSQLCAVCDDFYLEKAASDLIGAACNEKIMVFGSNDIDMIQMVVPAQCFIAESQFTGDVRDAIIFSDVPVIRWILDHEEDWRTGDGDTIENRSKILWRRLCVKRADLLKMWPAEGHELNHADGDSSSINGEIAPRAAPPESTGEKKQRRSKSVVIGEYMRAQSDHDPGKSVGDWRRHFKLQGKNDFEAADDMTILKARNHAWPPK